MEAKLTKLNRGYEVTRERYLDLVERRESAQLAQSADQSSSDIDFRVIEPPIVPSEPSSPKRALFLGWCIVGSFCCWACMEFFAIYIAANFYRFSAAKLCNRTACAGFCQFISVSTAQKEASLAVIVFCFGYIYASGRIWGCYFIT